MTTTTSQTPLNIAVVGLAVLYPQSTNTQEFWQNILSKKDLLKDIPPSHWLIEDYYNENPHAPDQTYCKRGAFLDPIPFDPFEFKIPPSILPSTDTSQLITLLATKQLLHDICQKPYQTLDLSHTSVILGTTGAQELMLNSSRLEKPLWLEGLRQNGIPETKAQQICDSIAALHTPWTESTFPGALGNVIAGRVANYFNVGGTNCVVDAACASSLSALSMGINELVLNQSNLVITGGVDTMQHIAMYLCFSKTPALSKTGDCRPFAADADGTMLGEGVGLLALKALDAAERDGDSIYAVIRGIGTSSDGAGKSVHVPVAEGQAKAIERAYAQASYSPNTVELIEAHGTATLAGDVAEFAGLRQVFENSLSSESHKKTWCALGSIKSQIGHTKGAAGAAGLIKTILALHHKVLPPTIKVNVPNPKLHIEDSPFYLNTSERPWISNNLHEPRRAGVSSFGFGGSNFHVALEEYTGSGKRPSLLRNMPTELLVFSGDSKEDLSNQCRALNDQDSGQNLTALAYQTQLKIQQHQSFRLAILATNQNYKQQLQIAIDGLMTGNIATKQNIFFNSSETPLFPSGKVAFLFPGQGSQYLNMGADLAMNFPAARKIFELAAKQNLNSEINLGKVIFPPPAFSTAQLSEQKTKLAQTEWTQPALATHSMALFSLFQLLNIKPDCVAGHSFGEITALSAANWCDFSTLLKIAQQRGQLMAEAARSSTGTMLAILHEINETLDFISTLPIKGLSYANYNSPLQLVISGNYDAIHQLEKELNQKQWSYLRLPVAGAFHSPSMESAKQPFANWLKLQSFNPLQIPVYSNLNSKLHDIQSTAICETLALQLVAPVQFMQQIETMYEQNTRIFVEMGPSTVLTQLVKQCLGDKNYLALALDDKGKHGVTQLWLGLAQLFITGINIDFKPLWNDYEPVIKTSTANSTLSKTTVMIQGCNYGKPYPPPDGAQGKTPPQPEIMLTPEKNEELPMNPPITPNDHHAFNHSQSITSPIEANVETNFMPTGNHEALMNFEYQIVQAHTAYQRAMAESHIAFLHTAERILALLSHQPSSNFMSSTPQPLSPPMMAQPPHTPPIQQSTPAPILNNPSTILPKAPMPSMSKLYPAQSASTMATSSVAPNPSSLNSGSAMPPLPTIASPSPSSLNSAPQHTFSPLKPAPIVQAAPPLSPLAHASISTVIPPSINAVTAATPTIEQMMLNIVAEKTGYPVEMLNLQMDLEADLGIDSIKRVEILSAAEQTIPNLPPINDPTEMATLKTLEDIAQYFKNINQQS